MMKITMIIDSYLLTGMKRIRNDNNDDDDDDDDDVDDSYDDRDRGGIHSIGHHGGKKAGNGLDPCNITPTPPKQDITHQNIQQR